MIVRTPRDFGAAVRDARLRLGWTQAALASRAEVSRPWLIAFEHGKSTVELGSVMRTLAALDLVLDVTRAPEASPAAIDLDDVLRDMS